MQSEHTFYALSMLEAKMNTDPELRESLLEVAGEEQIVTGLTDIAYMFLLMLSKRMHMEPADILKAVRTTAIVKSREA